MELLGFIEIYFYKDGLKSCIKEDKDQHTWEYHYQKREDVHCALQLQTMKLLVTGLPGVGKTTLLQELADTVPNPAGFLTLEVLKIPPFLILR